MLGEGVISSTDSSAVAGPYHDPSPNPERAATIIFFCENFVWASGRFQPSALCSCRKRLKPLNVPYLATLVRVGAPTSLLSYNPEQEPVSTCLEHLC